ncbi:MAG: YIP1 family protein [Oscillochloris sp.]|nr:YIP1 family protein [Oscillochloris sp.]
MFQEMINGSIAVITRPSVATFEEHERDNLGWALIYSLIAGLINGLLSALGSLIFPAAAMIPGGMDPETAGAVAATTGGTVIGTLIGVFIFTPIFLLIAWGITYGLGRAFGGTGSFGELAWGLSLFGAPLAIVSGIFSLIPFVGFILVLALLGYNFYLTYLAIQSGMNLEPRKALYVILIQLAIGLAIFACICVLFGAILAAMLGASGSFAP